MSSPALTSYVVVTGLTSRLVRATDAEHAEQLFLDSAPMLRHLKRAPGDIVVRVATELELEAFGIRRVLTPPPDIDPDTMVAGAPFVR